MSEKIQLENQQKQKICIHICEKKKRQCKFSVLKNSDYCVEHLAFNQQVLFYNPLLNQ